VFPPCNGQGVIDFTLKPAPLAQSQRQKARICRRRITSDTIIWAYPGVYVSSVVGMRAILVFAAIFADSLSLSAMHKQFFVSFFFLFLATLATAQCVSGDCQNGQGTYQFPSGAKYTGQFRSGEIHGLGVCYYSDGSKYQGEWKNRYPEGNGIKTYSDGTKREGLWKKGKPVDAQGKLLEEYVVKSKVEQQDDGTTVQSGCISGDCKDGKGIFAYPDGSKYEGEFRAGKIGGYGIWYFPNGDKYVGSFVNSFPHGKGTLHRADGKRQTGEWRQGEFFGSSLIESGKTGCIEGNCKDGEGVYVFEGGSAKYSGFFKGGKPYGQGVCVFSNGDRFRGNWVDGAFDGKGTLFLANGTEIAGFWSAGEYAGKTDPNVKPTEVPTKTEDAIIAATEPEKPKKEKPEKEKPGKEKPAEEVATPSPSDIAAPPKVWAIIAGVAGYNHMPVLRYTDDDAYRFYAFLKGLEGGALPDEQVQIMIDEEATLDNIRGGLRNMFAKAGPNDLIIFYFSGHGLNGSFLPYDFDGYNNKLAHSEVAEIFAESKAKYKLCLADACHSGSILSMRSTEVEQTLTTYYEQLSKSISGTALLMSSKSDETSLESSGLRQGVFSHFLIRGLKGEADKDKSGIVSIGELFDFVLENVKTYTGNRQSPVIKGTYDPKMPVAVVRG
jgi:hypothetical protein